MKRSEMLDVARFLVCSWRLGSPARHVVIPTGDFVLDQVLENAVAVGVMPSWAANSLHFADARTGRVCVELDDILSWMWTAELASPYGDNDLRINVTKATARRLLERHGTAMSEAMRLGEFLAREVGS
jgi:hypothetical protein